MRTAAYVLAVFFVAGSTAVSIVHVLDALGVGPSLSGLIASLAFMLVAFAADRRFP
jgi:hypothetical protein